MMHYPMYEPTSGEVDAFVDTVEVGRLVTVGGHPHIGLFPFIHRADSIELHLNRRDEQVADLRANAACAFEVDDVLGTIPSHWIDAENAVFATAYHRTVIFECTAIVTRDAAAMATLQNEFMARYQPEGGYRSVDAADPMYEAMVGMLVHVHLDISRVRAKFKIGQNRPPDVRAGVADLLETRGRDRDRAAAEALRSTIR